MFILEKVKQKSFAERQQIFFELPWKEKLMVNGFPSEPDNNTPLPEDLPFEVLLQESSNIHEMKQAAAEHALQKAINDVGNSNDSNESDDEESDDDYSCDGSPYCRCRDCTRPTKRVKTLSDRVEVYIKALPNCLLFDTAFRVRWPRKSDADLCWCPCGKYMKPWQSFYNLSAEVANSCGNRAGKKMTPTGLIAHLRKQGEFCPYHKYTYCYLEELYKNHNGTGHKALFEHVNYEKFTNAKSAENAQNQRMFEDLRAALQASQDREQRMREENDEFKKKMERLDKVNHDLRLKNEAARELLKNLNLGNRKSEVVEVESSEDDLASYRFIYDNFINGIKQSVECMPNKEKKKPKRPIQFKVENNFSLQELFDEFDEYGSKDKSFLFKDLEFSKDRHWHVLKFIIPWKITFGESIKKGGPIDEGGPTKHFFDQVWQQMLALEVDEMGLKVKLFEGSRMSLTPSSNDVIMCQNLTTVCDDARESIKRKAERYYRAIGRVMFHCLMMKQVIASNAISVFYRNVLFRECDLQDDRYDHARIIKDLGDSEASETSMLNQLNGMFGSGLTLGDYGIESDDPNEKVTNENFFSKVIHYYYIAEKSIAIDSLREGLTMDGFANFSTVLRVMPEEAVSGLLFGQTEINAEDVIGVLNPVYTKTKDEVIISTQKQFYEQVFKTVIEELSAKDKTFLRDFLSFVTGLTYIPHPFAKPDYEISVEFGLDARHLAEGALPESKTCANALILPLYAYNCNKELFEEKLMESLSEMKENNFTDS